MCSYRARLLSGDGDAARSICFPGLPIGCALTQLTTQAYRFGCKPRNQPLRTWPKQLASYAIPKADVLVNLLPGQPYGERLTALNTRIVRFNVQVDFAATRLQLGGSRCGWLRPRTLRYRPRRECS